MDLLFQRYASPFLILDEMIHLQQLHEFVVTVTEKISEEKHEEIMWEYFLHKVFNKSFDEFLKETEAKKNEHTEMGNDEIKDVIADSKNILDSFDIEK